MRAALLLLSLFGCSIAHAALLTVTRTDDPVPGACLRTDCSLREALLAANAQAGRDVVVLQAATYLLTRSSDGQSVGAKGALLAHGDIDIVGHRSGGTVIRWQSSPLGLRPSRDEIIRVGLYNGPSTSAVLRDLTLQDGRGRSGGCVHVVSEVPALTLALQRVRIEGCRSTGNGGALWLSNATLELDHSVLVKNHSDYNGGAIYGNRDSTILMRESRIVQNHAEADGGGIAWYNPGLGFTAPGPVTLIADGASYISSNSAEGNGGGIALLWDVGLTLSGPPSLLRIENNMAMGDGGGLWRGAEQGMPAVSSTISRVRFFDNVATRGGAIALDRAVTRPVQIEIVASQIRENAAEHGGGLWLPDDRAQARVDGVSFERNSATQGGAVSSCGTVWARNVSFHDNHAVLGAVAHSTGRLEFEHVSVGAHEGPALALQYATNCLNGGAEFRNSLVLSGCALNPLVTATSAGGNQYGPAAQDCPELPGADQRQGADEVFALQSADFGHVFPVLGWSDNGTTRPQQDFLPTGASCAALDVRGLPRSDGRCDAGAFELQQP